MRKATFSSSEGIDMATAYDPSAGGSQGGSALQPATAVILYNRRTGAIFSTHYFSATEGATLPDKDELEQLALAHAVKDGCDAKGHKAIHVDPAALKRGTVYRVSIAKGVLAEVKAGRQRPRSL
jgi:hypothetical protein